MSQTQKKKKNVVYFLDFFFTLQRSQKMRTGREFLADRRQNQVSEHLGFFFLIFLPLRVRLLDRFFSGLVERGPEEAEFLELGTSAPLLSLSACRRCCSRALGIGVLVADWLRRCWPTARAAPRPAPLTSLPSRRRRACARLASERAASQ